MSETGMRIGAAGNQAATVVAGIGQGLTADQLGALYADLTVKFFDVMAGLEAGGGTGTPNNVVPIPTQQAAPVAVPAPAQAAPQAPTPPAAPIPGATDGDPEVEALWREFFANPADFWDNRGNKRTPNSPDFSHKTKKLPGKNFGPGLWVDDKKNPSWVGPALAQLG